MTVEPSESNPICYEYSTLDNIIWHILSFEKNQYTKVMVLVWLLGGLFIAFQLGFSDFGLSLLVIHLFSFKIICWYPHSFEIDLEYPGYTM